MPSQRHDSEPPLNDADARYCGDCQFTRFRASADGYVECLNCAARYTLPADLAHLIPEPSAALQAAPLKKVGFWRGLFGRPAPVTPRAQPRPSIPVGVAFCELDAPAPEAYHAPVYTYLWSLPGEPAPGTRVMVDAAGETKAAVVMHLGAEHGSERFKLKPVLRIALPRDRSNARRTGAVNTSRLDEVRTAIADGTPPVGSSLPPLPDHTATASDADTHGRAWWRIYKTAHEQGWPRRDVGAVKTVADEWFGIRDQS